MQMQLTQHRQHAALLLGYEQGTETVLHILACNHRKMDL